MLDVHPPHEPVHGWRDFLLHLLTITVGLLIALGLEATVEALHHRHLAAEARENIRHEIEANEQLVTANLAAIQRDAGEMKSNIAKARSLRDHVDLPGNADLHFDFSWSSFGESAWRTAHDTGALAYLPAAEVQRYADAYGQQALANQQALDVLSLQEAVPAALLLEASPSQLKPEDLHGLMQQAAVVHLRLRGLGQMIKDLRGAYAEVSGK